MADLLLNSNIANEMTGDIQQLNWTIDSVANSCENLMIEMEKTFKCTREQFNQTALHRPDVSKATLCRFLANCCGFLFSYRGQINHLRGEVDGQHGENFELEEENRTLKEEASWLKSSTIHAQQSVISLQAQLLDCKERKFDSVQSAVLYVMLWLNLCNLR